MVSSLHTELIKQSNLHHLPSLDLTCTALRVSKQPDDTSPHLPHPPSIHLSPGVQRSHTFSVGSFPHRSVTWAGCELTIYAAAAASYHPPVMTSTPRRQTACVKVVLESMKRQLLLLVEWQNTPHTLAALPSIAGQLHLRVLDYLCLFFSVCIHACALEAIVSHSSQWVKPAAFLYIFSVSIS